MIAPRRTRIILPIVAALCLAGGIVFATTPWKPFLEQQIRTVLRDAGFQNVALTLSKVGLRSLTVENVRFGDTAQEQARLDALVLNFSPWALLTGTADQLDVSGLRLEARKGQEKWTLTGFAPPESADSVPFLIPVTATTLDAYPVAQAQVTQSQIYLATPAWDLTAPFALTWKRMPAPQLDLNANGMALQTKGMRVDMPHVAAQATLNEKAQQWEGTWSVQDLRLSGAEIAVPEMSGKGTLTAKEDQILFTGRLASADGQTYVAFKVTSHLTDHAKSALMISSAAFPWHSGIVGAQDVAFSLEKAKPIDVKLALNKISLDALLQELTGKRASGSGAISGTLPITIQTDGSIKVHEGNLSAEGPGVIRMSPDVVPGDNAQVALVRDVMQNLNYTRLSVDVRSEEGKGLALVMKVEGRNPDMKDGRPVQLNIRLTGDVLDFVRQNMILFTDPRKYLEQTQHAKP